MPLNLIHPHTALSQALEHLNRQTKEAVARDFGKWRCIEFSKTPRTRTVRFMVNPHGEAMACLTRNPDGTIEHVSEQTRYPDTQNLFQSRDWMYTRLHQTVQAELMKDISLHWEPMVTATAFANPDKAQLLHQAISHTAQDLVRRATETAVMPRGTKQVHPKDFNQTGNRIIREQILPKGSYELISKGFPYGHTAQHHNQLGANPHLQQLLEYLNRHPSLFKIAARILPVTFFASATSEDIDRELIQALGIDPQLWQLAKNLADQAQWTPYAGLDSIAATIRAAAALPQAPNTPLVQAALAAHPHQVKRTQTLPGETARQWHTLLNLLCFHPQLNPREINIAITRTLQGMDEESPLPIPQTWDQCRRTYYL